MYKLFKFKILEFMNVYFQVDKLDACVSDLHKQNVRTLTPEPKIGASGCPIIFLHPKDTSNVLIELEQVDSESKHT